MRMAEMVEFEKVEHEEEYSGVEQNKRAEY